MGNRFTGSVDEIPESFQFSRSFSRHFNTAFGPTNRAPPHSSPNPQDWNSTHLGDECDEKPGSLCNRRKCSRPEKLFHANEDAEFNASKIPRSRRDSNLHEKPRRSSLDLG